MKYKIASLLFITLFYVQAFSQLSIEDPACTLNFTAYPYLPIGGCSSVEEKVKDWNGFPKTSCCQNALTVFSHALALHAHNDSSGNIFIPEDQWKNCNGAFKLQPSVSVETCGFDNFFYGNGQCSKFQLSHFFKENQDVISQCSLFNSSSFDDACGNCTTGRITEIAPAFSGLYRFSKAEIHNALDYGGEKKCLGRGSAGQVYKGMLPSGQLVAIKHIYKGNKSNTSDSFHREIEGLSRVRHPNLVCLFGCCIEDGEQYLVYEYCSAGNLAQNVLRKDTVLTWDTRVKILRDCAFALKYLHNHIDGCIVHRDIKLTNILLTANFDPKLSDFGLAKMLGMDETKVFTDVRGTIGYMDPEYMSNAKLTCASDIYSFGIVILQLLSGQRVIELDLEARDQLTRKAKDVNMGKRPLTDFQDPRIKGSVNTVDFESILQIAVLCVASSGRGRPTIDLVFEELDKAWRNTEAEMKAKEKHSSATTPSKSQDLICV